MVLVQVLLELVERERVAVLVLTNAGRMLLHAKIRQMNKCRFLSATVAVLRLGREDRARRAQVALAVQEDLKIVGDEHPHPNVELFLVNDQRVFDVFHTDPLLVFASEKLLDFFQVTN